MASTGQERSLLGSKIEATEELLSEKEYDMGDALIGIDWNGPIADTQDHRKVRDEVREEITILDDYDVEAALVSGHPMSNLEEFREILDMPSLHRVGELGSMYAKNGDCPEPVDPEFTGEVIDDFYRELYSTAADRETKILPQANVSNTVGCVRIEAEGNEDDPRGGTYRLPDSQTAEDTRDIWQYLEDESGFEYDRDKSAVVFENTWGNASTLTETLTHNFRYPGIRFERAEDDKIAFYRDREDSDWVEGPEDAHRFIQEVGDDFDLEFYKNDDYGADFKVKGAEADKYKGMRELGKSLYGEDPFKFHVGDKKGDIMMEDDAVFFPQEGSQAHRMLKQQGYIENRDYVPVENAAEYVKILDRIGL